MKKITLSLIAFMAISFCANSQSAIIVTTQDLLKYKQECYNDSSTKCFDRYTTLSYYSNENDSADWPHCRDRRWVHKPCTFEGFIKWLEHKYRGALPKQK